MSEGFVVIFQTLFITNTISLFTAGLLRFSFFSSQFGSLFLQIRAFNLVYAFVGRPRLALFPDFLSCFLCAAGSSVPDLITGIFSFLLVGLDEMFPNH